MANMNKITRLSFIFFLTTSFLQAVSAKSQINIDLETTEAFCLRGLRPFLSFSQQSSHLAHIFQGMKPSGWNRAEGTRRRGQGRSLGGFGRYHCLTNETNLSWLSFSGSYCVCVSVFSLCHVSSPFVSFSSFTNLHFCLYLSVHLPFL